MAERAWGDLQTLPNHFEAGEPVGHLRTSVSGGSAG
jgi:hypothetical protein